MTRDPAGSGLPTPPDEALAASGLLVDRIRAEIEAAGGTIAFSRYMELCLYAPGLGYYSNSLAKFGQAGDFVTAPEVSPLFGRCIARSCRAVLEETGGSLLEFGAGSGRLAVDVLAELDALHSLPKNYYILERSGDLAGRQRDLLASSGYLDHVTWLDTLPDEGFDGVMFGNEVLDAMAVECFRVAGDGIELLYIANGEDGLEAQWRPPPDGNERRHIVQLAGAQGLPDGYVSEYNSSLAPWIASLGEILGKGMLLFIDYGYTRREYYHEEHAGGTLMCHYRQRAHDDYLLWPGLQDLTAHVDFTAVAEAATEAGLDVAGYTTQAYFLLDSGIDELLQQDDVGSVDYLKQAQQAKTLLLPGEMGERFKCMALTRGLDSGIPGFRGQDYRNRL